MKNFLKIAQNVNVTPLLLAIARQPELWEQNTIRQDFDLSPHKQTKNILLRFNKITTFDEVVNDTMCENYPPMALLPEARPLVYGLMAQVQGEQLGRALVVNLPKGCKVTPHVDMGAPATYYQRYHIVLQSKVGNVFRAGDEYIHMLPGEVWWFNNEVEHEVTNNSDDDRLHLIVDIRST